MKIEQEIYLAVLGDTDLKHHHKNLYLYLLWLSGQEDSRKKGGVFAGNKHLSKQLGSPVHSIADWLEGLEKMGLISRSMKDNKRVIKVNPFSTKQKCSIPSNKNVPTIEQKCSIPSNKNVLTIEQKCSIPSNKNVLDNTDLNTDTNTDVTTEVNTGETNDVDWGRDNKRKFPLREKDSIKIITLFNWWKCGNKEASKEEWFYVPEKQRDLYCVWLEEEMELSRNGQQQIVDERIPFEEVLKQRIVGSPQYNGYIQQMQLA